MNVFHFYVINSEHCTKLPRINLQKLAASLRLKPFSVWVLDQLVP